MGFINNFNSRNTEGLKDGAFNYNKQYQIIYLI